MMDYLAGHGIHICACGELLSKCDCPEHQDVYITVSDSCAECKEAPVDPDMLGAVELEDEACYPQWKPSVECEALATEVLSNVLNLDVGIERDPRDISYLLMIAEVNLIREVVKLQHESNKLLKQIYFELEK